MEETVGKLEEKLSEITGFYENNQLEEAIETSQQMLELAARSGQHFYYANGLNCLGVMHAALGHVSVSIDYFLEALSYAEKYQVKDMIAVIYNNIGSRYQHNEEHEKAITYFLKATESMENEEYEAERRKALQKKRLIVAYLNLAIAYGNTGKYEESRRYIHMIYALTDIDENPGISFSIRILECKIHWKQKDEEYAYQHLDELLQEAAKMESLFEYDLNIADLCDLLTEMKEYEKMDEILTCLERYVEGQQENHIRISAMKKRLAYYQLIGDEEAYKATCVDLVDAMEAQQEEERQERVRTMDTRIELKRQEDEREEAEKRSQTDSLTGLKNRWSLKEEFKKKGASMRGQYILGIVDIDFFKQVNDLYGHVKGDEYLQVIGNAMRQNCVGRGIVYRYGGDEFVMLLDGEKIESIHAFAQELQESVKALGLYNEYSEEKRATISQGYTVFLADEEEFEDALRRADKALYKVKEQGRNHYGIM